jgi:hypothetical protein
VRAVAESTPQSLRATEIDLKEHNSTGQKPKREDK